MTRAEAQILLAKLKQYMSGGGVVDRKANEALDMAIEALRQPERKTGHWIRHPEQKNIYGGKCIECSECGEKYIVQYIEDEKFCRNCGADMIGEEDERNKDF